MPATKRRLSLSHNEPPYIQQGSEHRLSEHAQEQRKILERADVILEMMRTKRQCLHGSIARIDRISKLSDELLLRILGYMDEHQLLDLSLVSKRFNVLSADPHLWKDHYYRRFILPRADLIPGFKAENAAPSLSQDTIAAAAMMGPARPPANPIDPSDTSANVLELIDWKKQYKMRHNWDKGRCEVYHVHLNNSRASSALQERGTLVKMTDKFIVTADKDFGLRVWEIRTGLPLVIQPLAAYDGFEMKPTCLYLETRRFYAGILEMVLGFEDGTFGIWKFDLDEVSLSLLYRQERSCFTNLVSVAYSYPYVVTASRFGFVSIYTFEHEEARRAAAANTTNATSNQIPTPAATPPPPPPPTNHPDFGEPQQTTRYIFNGYSNLFPVPFLLSRLKSQFSRSPLSLSIRQVPGGFIVSIAYAFKDHEGWSIGIQDFSIRPSGTSDPDTVTSTVSFSTPLDLPVAPPPSPVSSPQRSSSLPPAEHEPEADGPRKLVYSHPYLLSVLPDNTLMLHVCTTDTNSLSLGISRGVRLWGHTSGISDVDVTARGKAVSISTRGDEVRIWELEGVYQGQAWK
ncbi:hypothetical protein PT974_01510 [Cladobotryum mycophilum]|uniref:F-box domain-containing protein n=1 Tax=Cladobotryum mycophilum TaxID=491253 RepID=A0ABR0T5A9_9HYPO